MRNAVLLGLMIFWPACLLGQEDMALTIKTLKAQMRYDTKRIVAKPGQNVTITLVNEDDLPHNLVIFKPGTDAVALSNKQLDNPDVALKRNWLPDDPSVLFHGKMMNPGETDKIVFKAPQETGTYPFACTFPGHAAIMQGVLQVVSPGGGLKDLEFSLYLGNWDKLPDFSKLEVHRKGKIEDNLIAIKLDDYKNQFGIVYTGKLTVAKDGDHEFFLTSDDGSRIFIDGKAVAAHDGVHPVGAMQKGKVNLKKGEHDFRLEYFQGGGDIALFAGWSGPGFSPTPLSSWMPEGWDTPGGGKQESNPAMPLIVGNEAVIYRNFIQDTGNRGVGVGYPGGFNITWSAENMNLLLLWRGAFIDAAKHWKDRGGGHQVPLGYDVMKVGAGQPLAVLAKAGDAWPDLAPDSPDYRWKGYHLDAVRAPVFHYEWMGVTVNDAFRVEGNGQTPEGVFHRKVSLKGTIPANAWFSVVSGVDKIEPKGDGFVIKDRLLVTVDGAVISGNRLLVPAAGEIAIRYQWLP